MARKHITAGDISEKRRAAFWLLVAKSSDDGCWLWQGHKTKGGYGQFSVGGRAHGSEGAHRVSWLLAGGQLPVGVSLLHDCPDGDNPACVNPAHLRLGTQRENLEDASSKGRLRTGDSHWTRRLPGRVARGEAAGNSSLTEEAVVQIRLAAAAGVALASLASRYGISTVAVGNAVHRRTWKHVL